MTFRYYLDGDFVRAIIGAMRDPRTIPVALANISATIAEMRVERDDAIAYFDQTIALLEKTVADLRARANLGGTRHPVAAATVPAKGPSSGSKREAVVLIVSDLSRDRGYATFSEIVDEMDRRGLFTRVGANKRQNATRTLSELRQAGHLASDGHSHWSVPISGPSTDVRPAASRSENSQPTRSTRLNSKRDQCAKIIKSLSENGTRSVKRQEIKRAWSEAGIFDGSMNEESMLAGLLHHLHNYGQISTDYKGNWSWIGLR
jgi:hypothetical protein